MDENRKRPRRAASLDRTLATRAELVRYFAWGYLSRRELNEHLRQLEPQERRTAAA